MRDIYEDDFRKSLPGLLEISPEDGVELIASKSWLMCWNTIVEILRCDDAPIGGEDCADFLMGTEYE